MFPTPQETYFWSINTFPPFGGLCKLEAREEGDSPGFSSKEGVAAILSLVSKSEVAS